MMAGNNRLGVKVRTIGEDLRWWKGLAQEVKAVEEEIRTLVATGRRRLFRAVDEEMRWMLRESLASLSEMSWPEPLPEAWKAREAPLAQAGRDNPSRGETQGNQRQGIAEQTPAPVVRDDADEKRQAVASLNGHEPSPAMATLAEAAASQDDTRGHDGAQNGTKDHEETPVDAAVKGAPTGSGETYSGTVQLVVAVEQSAIQALQLVDALCRHPSMRLQRLLGTAKGRLDIWVLLREPMHLKEALLKMEGVSQVNTIAAQDHQGAGVYLEVRLKEPVAAHGS